MSEQNKAAARRIVTDVYDQGRLDAADDIFSADAVIHYPGGEVLRGPEAIKAHATMIRAAFPDMRNPVEDEIAEGNKVAVRWSAQGTHEGDLMGIPPTHKPWRLTGIAISRFLDGKVVEQWAEFDLSAVIRELGEQIAELQSILVDKNRELEAQLIELRHTQAQLVQSEKMASLGKLSAGVAHELNNPAAAGQRGADQLQAAFSGLQEIYLQMSQLGFSAAQRDVLMALDQDTRERAKQPTHLDALTRSDLEYELETLIQVHGIEDAWELAPTLVSLGYDEPNLQSLTEHFTADQFPSVIRWLCYTHTIYSLLSDLSLGTHRIAEIVSALKAYTYMDQAPIQSVDVHEGLDNTLIILQNKLKADITVHRDYGELIPSIEAYGSELNQVWTNIIDNAIDSMAGEGEITLRTRREGEFVVVEIEDNGPGIPDENQTKIFDPFFTTKPPGHGSGLGLSISHNIIAQQHGGRISVSSQPGKTCFQVRLPLRLATAQ